MLNPDYRDMLSALFDAEVDLVVVGALALAAHGNPRSTGDIDIFVRPTVNNAERVLNALALFGAPTTDLATEDLTCPDMVIQIGVAPRRIDLLTSISGVDSFDKVWRSKITASVDDIDIPVLSRELLIRNKRAVGRPQDLADIAWLKAHPE